MNPTHYSFWDYFLNAHGNPAPYGEFWYITVLQMLVRCLIGIFAILLGVPILVWYERRLLSWMQQRQGPNRVGPFGLLQTIADGVKLLFKEDMNPGSVDKVLFVLAPIVFLLPALVTPGVIPWGPSPVWGTPAPGINVGILYVLAWASLAVYGIVLAGWSSNNKYSLLGGLRSSAQIISYELGMGLAIMTVVLMCGQLDLQQIVAQQGYDDHWFGIQVPAALAIGQWNLGKFFPMGLLAMIVYSITMLAETNRAPFDLPEAETELVAGYHTEYTSMKFATFFLGEYANMVVVSAINATLFWGGYHAPIQALDGQYLGRLVSGGHDPAPYSFGSVVAALVPVGWFLFKTIMGLYFFIWCRATLPRLRYDQLMKFGWQGVLPVTLFNILAVAVALTFGYLIGLGVWLVVFAVLIYMLASNRRVQKFTNNTRRKEGLALYSSAQPFRAVAEHVGRGGQTLPPDAPLGPGTTLAEAPGDSTLTQKG